MFSEWFCSSFLQVLSFLALGFWNYLLKIGFLPWFFVILFL